MVNPTTPNIVLEQPLRGSEVGTWDTPVNSNTGIIDSAFGGVTSLAMSSADVTLTSSQAQSSILRLTGTITANVAIILPAIYKGWTIDNQIVNSPSSYSARMLSSGGTFSIGLPQGVNDIFYDGTSIKYRNLGRVGEYWDYAGSAVPTWVGLCTTPPWLNCNGTTFSSATYPILANLLGTTTLPDARGRFRATLNQTTSRLTSSQGGVDGDTILSAGSSQTATLLTANLPAYSPSGSVTITAADNGTRIQTNGTANVSLQSGAGGYGWTNVPTIISGQSVASYSGILNGTAQGGTSTPFSKVPPTYVGGITMIRAV